MNAYEPILVTEEGSSNSTSSKNLLWTKHLLLIEVSVFGIVNFLAKDVGSKLSSKIALFVAKIL